MDGLGRAVDEPRLRVEVDEARAIRRARLKVVLERCVELEDVGARVGLVGVAERAHDRRDLDLGRREREQQGDDVVHAGLGALASEPVGPAHVSVDCPRSARTRREPAH